MLHRISVAAPFSQPLSIELKTDFAPAINEVVAITATAFATEMLEDATISFVLPEDAELISGDRQWVGELMAGFPIEHTIEVIFTKPGNKVILANLSSPIDERSSWGDSESLNLYVGETAGKLGYQTHPDQRLDLRRTGATTDIPTTRSPIPPNREIMHVEPMWTPVSQLDEEVVMVTDDTMLREMTTVSGRCLYVTNADWGIILPIRYATIWLYDEDNASPDDHVGSAVTDENGYWEIGPIDNNDPEGGTLDLYAVIVTATDINRVENPYGAVPYTWNTETIDNISGEIFFLGEVTLDLDYDSHQAMDVYQVLMDAYLFPPNSPGSCTIVWHMDYEDEDAPFYDVGYKVWLESDDYWEPGVILHEVAHNYMWNVYGGYNPPSPNCDGHSLGIASGPGCAWTEGWASFFALAVYNDPILELIGMDGIDFENPPNEWDSGDEVEGRIVAALWDIFDDQIDGIDLSMFGFNEIWSILYNQNNDNFQEFWETWQNYDYNTHYCVASIANNSISYNSPPVLDGIPDIYLEQDQSYDNAIDLWAYSSDEHSSDSELTFVITNVSELGAGISIDADRYIDIAPTTGWSGTASVTVAVSDLVDSDTDIFSVNIAGSGPPHVVLHPTSLHYEAVQGDPSPQPQTFTLTNSGGGSLSWGIMDNSESWYSAEPIMGTSNYEVITVDINTTDLNPGNHTTTLVVWSANADNQVSLLYITYLIIGGENQPPELSSGIFNPAYGSPNTSFTFEVAYADPDDDNPYTIQVVIDETSHDMSLFSGTASNGIYNYQTQLPEGEHTHYFQADDGQGNTCRLPENGNLTGPVVSPSNPDPVFSESTILLINASNGTADWLDVDDDGYLDILLTGEDEANNLISEIYLNTGAASFNLITSGIVGLSATAVAPGDYNGDGKIDLLLTGIDGPGSTVFNLYGGSSDGFIEIPSPGGFQGVYHGSTNWGDFDQDGDLDILVTGGSYQGYQSKIFENLGDGDFELLPISLEAIYRGMSSWIDYDNDGDLDIVIAGLQGISGETIFYKNQTEGIFEELDTLIPGYGDAHFDWGDYDGDGDLDLVICGVDSLTETATIMTKVYRNDLTTFVEINSGVSGVVGSVQWGDCNNDGHLDILSAGYNGQTQETKVYLGNGAGEFSAIETEIHGIQGSAKWGDYDNDGDLDILTSGWGGGQKITSIYRNDIIGINNITPSSPIDLATVVAANGVSLSWGMASDDITPAFALNYNIRVGSTIDGNDIVPSLAHADGTRKIVGVGNSQNGLEHLIHGLQPGNYYWSVQSIDQSFRGGEFSETQEFTIFPTSVHAINSTPDHLFFDNYPNPFNSTTTISYYIHRNERVLLEVFDLAGRLITILVNEIQSSGLHQVNLELANISGRELTSGIYICRIQVEGFSGNIKMMHIK